MMQEKHLSHLLESGGREAGQAATPPPPGRVSKVEGGARGRGVGRAAGVRPS